jgi:hypothetical protein
MSASAVRMRALRRRQRDGKVPLRLEADEVGLQEVLIATRKLSEDERDNRAAMERGLTELVEALIADHVAHT